MMQKYGWKTLFILLLLAGIAWAAGTVTDYLTLTPAGAPGAAGEGTIYYDSDTDQHYGMDDGAVWYPMGPELRGFRPVAAASEAAEGYVYYDSDTDRLYVYTGAAAWLPLNEQTADEVYTAGSTIDVDTGALAISSTLVDGTDVMTITRSGAAGTGQLLQLADSQTGAHASMTITHTAGNASSGALYIADTADDATALAYLISLSSVDDAQVVTDALVIAATTAAGITDAIDVSDAEITNAINVGANTITGTTAIIDLDLFTIDAAGDVAFIETGGDNSDADFGTAGYTLLGTTDGGGLGDTDHRVEWASDGVLTFVGDARPTGERWVWVGELDLAIVGGDWTDPTENEIGAIYHWSSWEFTEGPTDYAAYVFPVPGNMDVSAALNIQLLWSDEDAAGNTAAWVVTYCAFALNADEIACDPTTALNTVIAADSTDVQYEMALTEAGVIDGGTLSDGDIVVFKIGLTSVTDGTEADLVGIKVTWSMESL